MLSRTFATRTVLCLLAIVITPSVAVRAQDAPTYYFDGTEQVSLQPSTNYQAFKLDDDSGTLRDILQALPPEIAERHPLLVRHNIVLFRRGNPMFPQSAGDVVQSLWEHLVSEGVPEAPVFARDGVEQVLVNEFDVQFRPDVQRAAAAAVLQDAGASTIERSESIRGRYTVTFALLDELAALAASNRLQQHQLVEFSVPNFVLILPGRPQPLQQGRATVPLSCSPSTVANDTWYSCQWALSNDGSVGIADVDIDAEGAWRLVANAPSQRDVIIAVIDTGVDIGHEDLSGKIVAPYDAVQDDNDPSPPALDGHGTLAAGVAAATTGNAKGIAGVARNAYIMPVRILATDRMGGGLLTDVPTIEKGLRAAVDGGAHVLVCPWFITENTRISAAIRYAVEAGRVVVLPTGNDGALSVKYPAKLSTSLSVIAVGATNQWDEHKTYRSADRDTTWASNGGLSINVVAPGVDILSTAANSRGSVGANANYGVFRGTSAAASMVGGIAALMLSVHADLSPTDVRRILQATSEDLGAAGFDLYYGHGRVNAQRAVSGALAER